MIRLLEEEDLDDVAEIWLILEFQKISFKILTKWHLHHQIPRTTQYAFVLW